VEIRSITAGHQQVDTVGHSKLYGVAIIGGFGPSSRPLTRDARKQRHTTL
jgi:hypothetical protein